MLTMVLVVVDAEPRPSTVALVGVSIWGEWSEWRGALRRMVVGSAREGANSTQSTQVGRGVGIAAIGRAPAEVWRSTEEKRERDGTRKMAA
ncbi:hypothetical protein ACHAXT_009841 [Thalassiosira profunda]